MKKTAILIIALIALTGCKERKASAAATPCRSDRDEHGHQDNPHGKH